MCIYLEIYLAWMCIFFQQVICRPENGILLVGYLITHEPTEFQNTPSQHHCGECHWKPKFIILYFIIVSSNQIHLKNKKWNNENWNSKLVYTFWDILSVFTLNKDTKREIDTSTTLCCRILFSPQQLQHDDYPWKIS